MKINFDTKIFPKLDISFAPYAILTSFFKNKIFI